MPVTLNHNKIGELDTLTVSSERYRAVVLLQGAQLIHFMTTDMTEVSDLYDNWLWISEHAIYEQGTAVRGGIPICWPVFGQFNANPQTVQDSFKDSPFELNQHGYARLQPFKLDSLDVSCIDEVNLRADENLHDKCIDADKTSSKLILKLNKPNSDATHPACHLDLKVKFEFSARGFAITLISQNNSDKTIHFSQALHTYLPTDDITQTKISGSDGLPYSDTLLTNHKTGNWQINTQHGDITFNGEVDRIYHGAPDMTLRTPAHTYLLQARGSNSTVVWNPWQDKAKSISQMAADDYQRMLCIETANAHMDVIKLLPSHIHCLTMCLTKQSNQMSKASC